MRRASELSAVIKRRLLDEDSAAAVRTFETFFYGWLERSEPALLKEIRGEATAMSPALRATLTRAVQDARRAFAPDPSSYREDGGEA